MPNAEGGIQRFPNLLKPSGALEDSFGNAVAISGDTAVVGTRRDDVGANIDQGSATVFRWNGSAWLVEAELVASDGAANDYFGASVAIDGDTIIVGAYGDDVGGNTDQGSAYAFTRTGTTWTQQLRLVALDGAAFDSFGISVSLSGGTAVIGAESDDVGANANQGSAYVFHRPFSTWSQQAKLVASDGGANDLFGGSVDISGNTAIVGARSDDIGASTNEGSAFIFTRTGGVWSQQAKLRATDNKANDFFGDAVAISGETVAVGAFNDDVGTNARQGSVSIFVRANATWTQQANLIAEDGAADDGFGSAVDLWGDTLVVGASFDDVIAEVDQGSAYVFARLGSAWIQHAKLSWGDGGEAFGACIAVDADIVMAGVPLADVATNSDRRGVVVAYRRDGSSWNAPALLTGNEGASAHDQYGASVAIDDSVLAIGVPFDDRSGKADSGSVNVVTVRAGESAPLTFNDVPDAVLTPLDGAVGDNFGSRVSISGNTILAGAANKTIAGAAQRGAAYFYTKNGEKSWQQLGSTILASDGAAGDGFGGATSLRGDIAIIGASGKDTGGVLNHGAVYVFERSSGIFAQTAKLQLPAPIAGDFFGCSVGAGIDLVAAGAYNKQIGANASQGAAYVFARDGAGWKLDAGLVASDGATGDCFGISMALDGETLAVGAFNKSINGAAGRGAVYVFARTNSGWIQTARVIAPDGAAGDAFGWRVDLSGGKLVVGAPNRDSAGRANTGAVYVFASASGSAAGPWVEAQRITQSAPVADDSLGGAVAIAGTTVLAGMVGTDFGPSLINAGAALVFDIEKSPFISAYNATLNAQYSTLDAAMSAASAGHTVIGSAGAFLFANPDFAGRAISLRSLSRIALPSASTVRLGAGAELRAAINSDVSIDGALVLANDSGRSHIFASTFTLGSTGSMTIDSHELVINAPSASLGGFVNLRTSSSVLTATNALSSAGVLNSSFGKISTGGNLNLSGTPNLLNSVISAGGPVTINATNAVLTQVTLLTPSLEVAGGKATLGGTISAPITNSGTILTAGSTTIYGNIINNAGAAIRLTGGTTALYGSVSGAGSVVGSFTGCPTCAGEPTVFTIENDLALDPGAFFSITGGAVEIGGNFDLQSFDSQDFGMSESTIRMSGIGARQQTFEVMSMDRGPIAAALSPNPAHSFPLGTLEIGSIPTTVTLVDARDNDGAGQIQREALYTETLIVSPGSRLNTAGFKIYCRTKSIGGTIDNPANIIALGSDCPTDLNADGLTDDADFVLFLAAYETLDCTDPAMPDGCASDFNSDGTVDDGDFGPFVTAYDALVCP